MAQIRIYSVKSSGKKPDIFLPPTGGAPIDPAVFGYIRVSQAEGESGLATQRRILNDSGLRDDRIFTDVASGRNMRRPSWIELHGMLKLGDTVVVPRLDRLARNLWEGLKTIEELHDQGINIRALAEGLDTGDDSPTRKDDAGELDIWVSQARLQVPSAFSDSAPPAHACLRIPSMRGE